MAENRFDIQSPLDRLFFYPGIGCMLGLPTQPTSSNATTGVPTDGIGGFAHGAIFINFKATTGNSIYQNIGTVTSAIWTLLSSAAGGSSFTGNTSFTGNNTFSGGTSTFANGIAVTGGNVALSGDVNVTMAGNGTKIGTAASQKIGFFNTTPAVQQATTATNSGFVAGVGVAVNVNSTFNGSLGATAYTISDIVLALKTLGLMQQ